MTNLIDDLDLKCSSCGVNVGSENVNRDAGVAVCGHCDGVFTFSTNDTVRNGLPIEETQGFLNRMMQSEQFIHTFLLVFMVFWNFSFLIFSITCASKGYIVLASMLGVITAIGFYLTYFLVAALFGSPKATSQKLLVNSWENILPIFGGQREVIDNRYLRDVFAEKLQFARREDQRTTTYKVRGVNQNGAKIDLVNNLTQENQAIEIETEIRKLIRQA
ncbi:MAG: hypothetical protein R3E32_26040 [Chitinophagales bacterium]